MPNILLTGSFDDFRSRDIRILHEASRLGPLHYKLWSDTLVSALTGSAPKFPVEERQYIVQAMRFVEHCDVVDSLEQAFEAKGDWVAPQAQADACPFPACVHILNEDQLAGFPEIPVKFSGAQKVLVTGCYDWMHSGHIRFFEEASQHGDLIVVAGNDANVELLKGEGHPLIKQDERRYMVGAVRYVTMSLISTGTGWMDAEPEVITYKPDIYLVNEDGDRPVKREFCEEHNLDYVVLKRKPKEGLTRRSSTDLRGF